MDKQEFGKKIETLRKDCGVSTYELEQKGYSMNSLIKYLNAIDEDFFLSVGKKEKKKT